MALLMPSRWKLKVPLNKSQRCPDVKHRANNNQRNPQLSQNKIYRRKKNYLNLNKNIIQTINRSKLRIRESLAHLKWKTTAKFIRKNSVLSELTTQRKRPSNNGLILREKCCAVIILAGTKTTMVWGTKLSKCIQKRFMR